MLKRIGRYLKKHQRLRFEYGEQDSKEGQELRVYSDSDLAGRRATRKSRGGGVILMSGGLIRSWSNRQGSVALSSGEAEYYAVVKACAEALGAQALARDLGWDLKVKLGVDGSAAKATASKVSLGRVRHLEVRRLWLQDAVAKNKVELKKVRGKENLAHQNP